MTDQCKNAICAEFGVKDISDVVLTPDFQVMVVDSVVHGFCKECGWLNDSVEPDAQDYQCEDCGENAVTSIVELILF